MFWFYPNMLASNQNNNINFTSNPIYRVNLKRVSNGFEKGLKSAVISELNYREDAEELIKFKNYLLKKEKIVDEHILGKDFCDDFNNRLFKNEDCNAVEIIGKQSLSKRIMAFAHSYKDTDESYYLSLLYTNPKCQKINAHRTLKGMGGSSPRACFSKSKRLKRYKIDF